VIKNSLPVIQLEDFLYWLIFALVAMLTLLWKTNGALRLYSVAAPIVGMLLYFYFLSAWFMRPFCWLVMGIKKIVTKIFYKLCTPFALLYGMLRKICKERLYKFNKIAKKLLKYLQKCERIDVKNRFAALFKFKTPDGSDRIEGRSKKKRKK
jgi:hypothetical protein